MAGRLDGQRILLTGASSGVGVSAARAMAREGARLALVARTEDALEELAAELGAEAIAVPADLADREQAERAVDETVDRLGGLDVLVSNAAWAAFGHLDEVEPDDFDRTVSITFGGAVNIIRAALPELRKTRGLIVATLSLNSRTPLPGWGSYAASKHALRGLLGTLRVEEQSEGTGVRVAMLHPGPIDTEMFDKSVSATGRSPRVPPDAYTADFVGQAICEMVVSPRAELVLGGQTRLVDLLYDVSVTAGDRLMVFIDRWYRSEPDGSDERPTARESLFAPLQLGPRLLPSPKTPLRLGVNLVTVGARVVGLGRK